MGYAGNFSTQDQQLINNMLNQQAVLTQNQGAYQQSVAAEDTAILNQYRQNYLQMTGQTPGQQKKAVMPGIMDYVKTSPQGLTAKPNTGLMGALG